MDTDAAFLLAQASTPLSRVDMTLTAPARRIVAAMIAHWERTLEPHPPVDLLRTDGDTDRYYQRANGDVRILHLYGSAQSEAAT
jgi:hypothetical protein